MHPGSLFLGFSLFEFSCSSNSGTTAQINEAVQQHKENLRVWHEYNATGKALQQQLINTFDEPYIRGLRDWHTSYNNVSTMHILTHLYTTYCVITPINIEDNDTKMRAAFDPTLPIELLFDQIETAVEFADAGNRPYNPDQVVSRAYLLTLQTGLYANACRDWRRRTVLTQTIMWQESSQCVTEQCRSVRPSVTCVSSVLVFAHARSHYQRLSQRLTYSTISNLEPPFNLFATTRQAIVHVIWSPAHGLNTCF
jgi:hypothetical protein